jgi:methionyl-tRNA formyltransferase
MEAGLDTGPVLCRTTTPIGAHETPGQLHARLSTMGATLIVKALGQLDDLTPTPQPEIGVTYAAKIDKAEARVDWTRPPTEIDRHIRGLSPFPGAWCEINGQRVKLLGSRLATGLGAEQGAGQGAPGLVLDDALTIACGGGAVQLTKVQRAGKGAQDRATFLRGWPVPKGTQL